MFILIDHGKLEEGFGAGYLEGVWYALYGRSDTDGLQ